MSVTATPSELERFCAEQYYAFDAHAWLERAAADGARVAAVAEYLSGTSWFGHEDELASIAAAIRAGGRAQAGDLSLVRLSARTRYLVAQRKQK
ncbi:MAG TPA: hypothetical protein VEG36_15350 [Burkholderiales bacterium]|nr:hypothetical protein [Burkholderiales bacterium]